MRELISSEADHKPDNISITGRIANWVVYIALPILVGIPLFAVVFGILGLLSTIPIFRIVIMGLFGVLIGSIQWRVLGFRVGIAQKSWVCGTAAALVIGTVIGIVALGPDPEATCSDWPTGLNCSGWIIYNAGTFAIAGGVVGIVQALLLFEHTKISGWVVLPIAASGFIAGRVEGFFIDTVIKEMSHTTNNLSTRLIGGEMIGLPVAWIIFGCTALLVSLLIRRQAAQR